MNSGLRFRQYRNSATRIVSRWPSLTLARLRLPSPPTTKPRSPTRTPSRIAALVDMINGVDFYGFGFTEPDIHFVPAATTLTPQSGEFRATIPLAFFGGTNVPNPGNDISGYFNYVSNAVTLGNGTHSL